ncbi:Protein kinase-like domain [Lasallia pustulata]|uniref:Protein kinase-like domain n=1 Tax=Lasallia pustulata TaxID=136370 RepID=A0A1W5D8Q7_9LECA|nr:Protein kinase-like domain [Lasallia pustulata]
MKNTNWHNVTEMCSSLRQNLSCKVGESFTTGSQNLVRLVEFEDGVKWVARIWMGDGEEKDMRMAASAEKIMENQVATYRYLRRYTTIPVPDVYAFNARNNVEVGPPFMLLDYIHGTAADSIEELELGTNEEAVRQALKQLASMMVELGACKFDRIGSIFQNADGNFEIGPLVETDGGPYETAQEYYQALGERRFHVHASGHFANNQDARGDGGLHLPLLFSNFMPMFSNSVTDKGPFRLANTDFGFHNVLVDEKLNIVGLIDCDAIIAAPIHTVAQLPLAVCMSGKVPGYKSADPSRIKYRALGARWLDEFVPMVAAAEKAIGSETPIADVIVSDAASLIQGLSDYHGFQAWRNVEWVNGYWYLYYRLIQGPSAAVEFRDADMGVELEEDEEQRAWDDVGEVQEEISKEGGACREDDTDEGLERRLRYEAKTSNQDRSLQEEVAIKKKAEHEDANADSRESMVVELKRILKGELIAEVKEELAASIKKDLMEDLKNAVKEELKQELKLELTMELREAVKAAQSKGDNEIGGVDIEKTDEDLVKEDLVEEQGLHIGNVSDKVPQDNEKEEDVAEEGPSSGVEVGREVDKEGAVDDNEEQRESTEDAEEGSIMGP